MNSKGTHYKIQGHKTTHKMKCRVTEDTALPNVVSQLSCFTMYLLDRKRVTMILN